MRRARRSPWNFLNRNNTEPKSYFVHICSMPIISQSNASHRRPVSNGPASGLDAMPPIKLTDSELEAVFNAARPLHPHDRDAFRQAIATELSALPVVGDGAVHRAVGISKNPPKSFVVAATTQAKFDVPKAMHEGYNKNY